jgi:hypothetical protein
MIRWRWYKEAGYLGSPVGGRYERTGFYAILLALAFPGPGGLFLHYFNAPYGRLIRTGIGPTLPNWLGWLFMEAPASVVFCVLPCGFEPESHTAWAFLALWQFHYFYRFLLSFPAAREGETHTRQRGGMGYSITW